MCTVSHIANWEHTKRLEAALIASCGTESVHHVAILRAEFLDSFPAGVDPCETWLMSGAYNAARVGNVAILQWLHDELALFQNDTPGWHASMTLSAQLSSVAIQNNQPHVLQWLQDSGLQDRRPEMLLPFLMAKCCQFGRVELAQWVWGRVGPDHKAAIDNFESSLDSASVSRSAHNAREYLVMACASGNVAMAQWVYSTMDFRALDLVTRSGDTGWAAFQLTPEQAEEKHRKPLLPAAVQSGVVDMAEWVWTTFDGASGKLTACARDALDSNSLDMMRWLAAHVGKLTATTEELAHNSVLHYGLRDEPDDLVMYLLQHVLDVEGSVADAVLARLCLAKAIVDDRRLGLVRAIYDWAPAFFQTPMPVVPRDPMTVDGWEDDDEYVNTAVYPDTLFGMAYKAGAIATFDWLSETFPDVYFEDHKEYDGCNLRFLQWKHSRVPGGIQKAEFADIMRRAVWTNSLDVFEWIKALGVVEAADVIAKAHLEPRYMKVASLLAIWTFCGDDLYRPVFEAKRDTYVRTLCALGDGVGLAFSFAACDTAPALVTKNTCRADSYGDGDSRDSEYRHSICMKWLQGHHGVGEDPPKPSLAELRAKWLGFPPPSLHDDVESLLDDLEPALSE
jgi:hypothetical protein